MGNNFKQLIAFATITSLLLSGCAGMPITNTIDLSSYENIQSIANGEFATGVEYEAFANNVKALSESAAELSDSISGPEIAELADSVNDTAETVSELSKTLSDTVSSVNDAALESKQKLDEADFNADEFREGIESASIEELAGEIVLDEVKGTVMEEIQKYQISGMAALEAANERATKGVASITEGVLGFQSVYDENKSADELVEGAFDQIRVVSEGTNEIAAAATIVYQEAMKDATEAVKLVKDYGIESPELDQLEKTVETYKDSRVYFISPDLDSQIDLAEEQTKTAIANAVDENGEITISIDPEEIEKVTGPIVDNATQAATVIGEIAASEEQTNAVIDQAFDNAAYVANSARELAENATQVMQETSRMILSYVDEAQKYGVDKNTIDSAKEVLEFSENAEIVVLGGVDIEETLDETKTLVKDAISRARQINYEPIVDAAIESVSDMDVENQIAQASSIGEILLILQASGVEVAETVYDEYQKVAAYEIAEELPGLKDAYDDVDEAAIEAAIEESIMEDESTDDSSVSDEPSIINLDEMSDEELAALLISILGEDENYVIEDTAAALKKTPDKDIVVLYTNDVHGAVDDNLGYAKVAGYRNELNDSDVYTLLADGGDILSDNSSRTFAAGMDLIDVMNETGYDIASIGDHELDYGIKQLIRYENEADFPLICSNLVDTETGESVLEPYSISEIGGVKLAFVGIVTPDSRNNISISNFIAKCRGQYDLLEDEDGTKLTENVQNSIDMAKEEGADYIILISHLGINPGSAPYTTQEVVSKLTGIDAVLGSHTHVPGTDIAIKDADGNSIEFLRTGTKLNNIGALTITQEGDIKAELVNSVDTTDDYIKAFVEAML